MSGKDSTKFATSLTAVFEAIYSLTNGSGEFVHRGIQKLPPWSGTDYYKFIARPVSLYTIGRNMKRLQYKSAQEFVDDLAQMTWNARLYNQPDSQIYEDATVIDKFIRETAIPQLASVAQTSLQYPDFGPLAKYSEVRVKIEDSAMDVQEEEAEEEEEEDEEEKPQDAPVKRESTGRRGRPPILDKPYEARIKSILKYMKRIPHIEDVTYNLTDLFERLPDRSNVQYFKSVLKPISLNEIRSRVRSRKYADVQQFLNDLILMTDNAKSFNVSDPEILADVLLFDEQLQAIISREMLRPESDFIVVPYSSVDKLKTPLDAVTAKNRTYKVGDWVLIKNSNDSLKPIVGQIFKMWSTNNIQYINVCWYIRPEQTCHRVDRIFYKNEVCRTSDFSVHRSDDIIAPCYVMSLVQYQKGDIPHSILSRNIERFICEFHYDSNTYAFKKIRAWKSCLPEEVRHVEFPLIPLSGPRKLIKYDSPIKHLLKSDAIDDTRVAPTEGIEENGPPVVGAVYLKAPFYNDDLGQTSTSPKVSPAPQYDERETARKAFIYEPLSLKPVSAPASASALVSYRAKWNYTFSQCEELTHGQSGGYSDYASLNTHTKPEPSPAFRDSTPSNVGGQTAASTYSAVYPGGIVSYIEQKPEGSTEETVDGLSELMIKSAGKTVWFRAPPISIGEKMLTPVSHSAKYMAWKMKKAQKI